MGEGFFVPYLYVPSAGANYVKLVTPWGNVHMNKGLLEQVAVSVAVVVLTVMLWRFAARLNATLKKKTDTVDGEEDAEGDGDDEEEDEEPSSALDENKITKGEHSYYYTHQHQDGNGNSDTAKVSSFGWSNDKETVSIYLTDNVVKNMKEDQLVLKWTNTSLSMDLLNSPGGDIAKSLKISSLFQEITDVAWKAHKDTLTITLTKAKELPWTSLNGAAKKMEDHIEYDDALYD
ncbi:hypothetical protein PPTG_14029 [Phytophthora nicotianae INRA-310]|uniref:CS domain-containing protein n=2 Tax=Phytophthora nicotianae TaxID=4792 RepID=W2Q175_PHYN3|nr:hypothetical protein PPTG_14029 [Phytophthora nicotianae INRA-310]ETN06269.1 hypothetical protein PPTG_14029 [Phytophthora nicotianae INRA-310]KUF90459.1 hypothetical protein AM588_10003098 [Phytophthora nicotianae]